MTERPKISSTFMRRGGAHVEYALLVAFIASVAVVSIGVVGTKTQNAVCKPLQGLDRDRPAQMTPWSWSDETNNCEPEEGTSGFGDN